MQKTSRPIRILRALWGTSLAVLLAAPLAQADELHTPFHFDWNGVPLGRAVLDYEATDATYHATLDGESNQLGTLFARMVATAVADGALREAEALRPTRYATNYTIKKKQKSSTLEWNSAGKLTKELNLPVRQNETRPTIPASDKMGALDPLSAFWSLREMLKPGGKLAVQGGKTQVKVLDGKRLYALEATHLRPNVWRHSGGPMEATMLRVRRLAIAGFEPDEQLALEAGQAAEFYLYFCAQGADSCKPYEPLGLEMPVLFGLLRAAKDAVTTAPLERVGSTAL